jgi:hypothetical protein
LIDSNEDREMDFDDQRDYMDHEIPAGQFPTADPGPLHHFLSGMPDWMNINQEDTQLDFFILMPFKTGILRMLS